MQFRKVYRLAILILAGCSNAKTPVSTPVDGFLERYNDRYTQLYTASNEAQWKANIQIIPGDSTNDRASQKAQEAYAAFTGQKNIVDSVQNFLKDDKLTDVQRRQLQAILYFAGNNPEQAKDLVQQRIKAETEALSKLYGFTFRINGKAMVLGGNFATAGQ